MEQAKPGAQDTAKIPNAETLEALRQAQTREGLTSYDSVEEMMADLDDA